MGDASMPPFLERSVHRRREAPDVTLTLGVDADWCAAQALMIGFVVLVVSNWLWALFWAWPEQEPPAWLSPIRWGSIGIAAVLAAISAGRRSRGRSTLMSVLSWTSTGGWRCSRSGDGRVLACAVRLAIDLGDWVLLRVDPLGAEGACADPNSDTNPACRRAWLALSRSNHPASWHDLRLALAQRSAK